MSVSRLPSCVRRDFCIECFWISRLKSFCDGNLLVLAGPCLVLTCLPSASRRILWRKLLLPKPPINVSSTVRSGRRLDCRLNLNMKFNTVADRETAAKLFAEADWKGGTKAAPEPGRLIVFNIQAFITISNFQFRCCNSSALRFRPGGWTRGAGKLTMNRRGLLKKWRILAWFDL